MSSVSTSVADGVRRLYERLPYPAPVTNLDAYRDQQKTIDGSPKFYFQMFWPASVFREDLRVLVAGCGTSQAAKLAVQQPNVQFVGIDLSDQSLQYTGKLVEAYNIRNLKLHRLPIEQVETLDQQFDLILSTGVLHHLEDPDLGLRSLRDVLDPLGAMHLMVYAPYGRTGVYMMQEYCRRLGLQTTDGDLENLLALISSLPSDHPLQVFARNTNDFQSPNGIADALLHPQDRSFSVEQVFQWLDHNDMTFMRWFLQAPYLPQCGFAADLVHGCQLRALPPREQYAAMELVRGTMRTHTFVACHKDRPTGDCLIDVTHETWPLHIPSRLNGSVIFDKDLPRGVAAALGHRQHGFSDLRMELTPQQIQFCQAIDGRRTIAEIVLAVCSEQAASSTIQASYEFFAQLYRYDQILVRKPLLAQG